MNRSNGLYFPLIIDEGTILYPGIEQSIDASIKHILTWDYGKRYFNPAFGSRLNSMLGSGATNDVLTSLKQDIQDAIDNWEPRLSNVSVSLTANGEKVNLAISGQITNLKISYKFQSIL